MLSRAQAVIEEGVDWASLLSDSGKQGTFTLVYKNLGKLKNVPGDLLGKFKNAYYCSLRCNILTISEHDRIIEGLNGRGIDVISLKGPMTAEAIFGDIGVYPSGDIDILVKVRDIQRMKDFLESDGYVLLDKGFDDYRDFFIRELYHISLSKDGYVIEPHWNLFFRYFTAPPEFWWEESGAASMEGKSYLFLSPEKNILYNSFRLFSKGFCNLRFLGMAAELIKYYRDEIDWERMFSDAGRFKFENVLRTVLAMSAELLGAPVPGAYAEIKGLRARFLYRSARKMLLSGTDPHPVHKMVLAFLRDDLAGSFRVLFRRFFPSMGEIVSRYHLPVSSGKAVVYYILNPLFLITGRHQKLS